MLVLKQLGKSAADCARLARAVGDAPETHREALEWKRAMGLGEDSDAVEREILSGAAEAAAATLPALRVHESVKALILKEFGAYQKPGKPTYLAGTDPFTAACKIATLRRFPAGPMDWVISGVPRGWFGKMPPRDIPKALWYIYRQFGGLRPAFYIHIATAPRNRSLVIEKEVRRAYYRMAKSLILQPEMKGILCGAWFHDPAALQDAPHLAALNEPYSEHGGRIVTTIGEATPESGFLKHNPERRKAYEEGKQRIMLTLAMWPRAAAIAWANQHPELD